MKKLFVYSASIILLVACHRPEKQLGSVKIGMKKNEVISVVGEPKKKNVVNKTEIWDYPDSARTVVFRADTVYAIMTSARARLDSMNVWMDSTNQKAKKGFSNIGDKVEQVGDKIQNKLQGDTSRTK